jgi:hypothetical protein
MEQPSKFVIAVEPRSIKRGAIQSGEATTHAEAASIVHAQLAAAREGKMVAGENGGDLYKVFAYSTTPEGLPDKVITQELVRKKAA